MNREESSIFFSSFLHFLSIFLFISTEIEARQLQQICSSSCGDIKNISNSFRLKDNPAGCGDRDYVLSCGGNKTILDYLSGKYYVKRISYDERTINFVDVNFANGSCSLPYKSMLRPGMVYGYDYREDLYMIAERISYASFMNYSRNISDQAYSKVPCLSKNQSNVYVTYGRYSVSYIPKSFVLISLVPILVEDVEYPSYEAIRKLLESGFEYRWSVECRDCKAAGGYCNNRMDNFNCTIWTNVRSLMRYYIAAKISVLAAAIHITGRFILAPMVLLVFLIHKCRKTFMRVDNVEKFLRNQQSRLPKRYSYLEIIAMTNNFQDKLAQGGFGSVYKGQPHNGGLIAVKMLENSKFSAVEFINELSTIGRIHHVNVVQLLGFCSEGPKRALVYEYMPNGSLDRHIFSKKGKGKSLTWEKLHEIALGISLGIEYLHGGCDVCILHFDIKPHNILLDHNFIPKVSDFGLSKFCPKENEFVSISATRGSMGYIAPELISKNFGDVSCKSDVYSFGMLLLEMVGGRRNSCTNKLEDLELRNVTETEAMIVRKMYIIGLWCIQEKATDRPSMTEVKEMLEGSIDDLQMPINPFFFSPQQIFVREIESDASTELLISKSMK